MNTIDFSKKDIQTLPQDIFTFVSQPEYFKVLLAEHCKTHQLSNFVKFQHLLALNLSHNNLGVFVKNGQLQGLFLLKCLILRDNNINSINQSFFQTTQNLLLLDLGNNKINKCGKPFLALKVLITLNLNNNQICDLEAFKVFKQNQMNSLQFIGLKNNGIEDKYQKRFEESLLFFFPNLQCVLTRFCSQKDTHGFMEILDVDYYVEEIQIAQQQNDSLECSFNQNDTVEILNMITPINLSSARKSKKSANSVDSRYNSSYKKFDGYYLKKQIELRKKDLEQLDKFIKQDQTYKLELVRMQDNYKQFLKRMLQLGDIVDSSIDRLADFAECIDNLNGAKQQTLIKSILVKLQSQDKMDQSLIQIEEIINKMNELLI